MYYKKSLLLRHSPGAVIRKTGLTSLYVIRECLATVYGVFYSLKFKIMPNIHETSKVTYLFIEIDEIMKYRASILDKMECIILNIDQTISNISKGQTGSVELF